MEQPYITFGTNIYVLVTIGIWVCYWQLCYIPTVCDLSRYIMDDDEDDECMESNFDQIDREEHRSLQIGK